MIRLNMHTMQAYRHFKVYTIEVVNKNPPFVFKYNFSKDSIPCRYVGFLQISLSHKSVLLLLQSLWPFY